MAKVKAHHKRPSRSASLHPQQIPLDVISKGAKLFSVEVDAQASARSASKRRIADASSKAGSQMVRDWKSNLRLRPSDFVNVNLFSWPDGMYIPSSQAPDFVRPKPPADRFYTDAWADGKGVSSADAAAGTMFAWTQALTTDREVIGEAGLGIRFSPKNALSYIRFEPEVNCMVTYRAFVDFWPMLIAGTLRVQGSLLMAAWLLSPVTGQPPELIRPWNEVPVFDTGVRDAASDLSPDIHNVNTFQRNFSLSGLGTTFLLQGARTYILGVVARVRIRHNVTTADGKIIPYDSSKFKLYADLVCAVPDMFASVQNVLIP